MAAGEGSRSRGWCFTYWGTNGNHEKGIQGVLPGREAYETIDALYIVVGLETSKEGWKHHQGYVYFKNAVSLKSIKKKLPAGSHLEPARGNAEQNFEYCSKESILFEAGNKPAQGKRIDLIKIKDLVKDGKGMREIMEIAPSYQGAKMGEMCLRYLERKRTWKPRVLWFWGPTGTFKTKNAREMCPDPENIWMSGKTLRWWGEYDAHKWVIIDDFRADYCTFHELLRILDRYPYIVETKGGHRQLLAETIVITSCHRPENVYQTREDIGQLLRRIDEIWEFRYTELNPGPYTPIRRIVGPDLKKIEDSKNFCAKIPDRAEPPGCKCPIEPLPEDSTGCVNPSDLTHKSGVILSPDHCELDEILSDLGIEI